MSDLLKSRHAFGSEANIDSALDRGLIDEYDILFLNEGKIGWIDKDGQKVILEDKEQVITVNELPETGISNTVYICDSKFYFWNGAEFISPIGDGVVNEVVVNEKVNAAIGEANAYTDEQIANAVRTEVIEF